MGGYSIVQTYRYSRRKSLLLFAPTLGRVLGLKESTVRRPVFSDEILTVSPSLKFW